MSAADGDRHLLAGFARMARVCLSRPDTRADLLLLLAEAFEEAADEATREQHAPVTVKAVRALAEELRRRAPDFA